jgi:DNA-binding transcriptional LysR family regulator
MSIGVNDQCVLDLDERLRSFLAMSDLVEFRHLKYIVGVAECGNITKASQRLFVAQPSLSEQIKFIEDEVGFPIFVRKPDGVEATPAGQMLVAYAREALAARGDILAIAHSVYSGEVPPLRIGFSSFVRPNIIQSFREAYGKFFVGCEVRLFSGYPENILQRLGNGDLHGAFLPLPLTGPDWVFHEVSSDPLVVCMRADDPLARESHVPFLALAAKLKIFRDPDMHPAAHKHLMEMLLGVGITPEISCSAATPADIQWMVRAGYGVAIVDQASVVDSELTTRPISGVQWTFDSAFVHHKEAEHLALRFITKVLQRMANKRSRKRVLLAAKDIPLQLDLLA